MAPLLRLTLLALCGLPPGAVVPCYAGSAANPGHDQAPVQMVTLESPRTVVAGTQFDFRWQPTVDPLDVIAIVPAAARKTAEGDFVRVHARRRHTLTAPGRAGEYELRYKLHADGRVVARTPIRVTPAHAVVKAPSQARAGTDVVVRWSTPLHPRDYIAIAPAGAPDDVVLTHRSVHEGRGTRLPLPASPGRYEIRYVLRSGNRVLSRTPITLTAPSVSLTSPLEAGAGQRLTVGIDSPLHPRDFVTIVPAHAPPGACDDYERVRSRTEISLLAPERPGRYEVRYLLQANRRAVARASLVVD